MWESNRDFTNLTKRGVWYAVLYNALAVVGIVIGVSKFGLNPVPSIQGMSDLVGFLIFLAFIFTTWGELVMLFYHWFEQARRIQIEQARQEARQELLQRFDQVFAGDKDVMEKRDQIFNGMTETKKK